MKFDRKYIAVISLTLAIGTFALYIFPSGLPQPSHILMLISFLSVISFITRKAFGQQIVILLSVISFYIAIRQLIYAMRTDHIDHVVLLPPIYFLFNTFLFATTSVLSIYMKNIEKYIKTGILLSLALALIGVFYFGFSLQAGDSGNFAYRAIGTFNNPNQLGYYSVCLAGIISLLYVNKNISLITYLMYYVAILFLAVLSLSKAAMVSVVFYLIIFIKDKKSLFFFVSIVLLVFILFNSIDLENFKFMHRLEDIGSADDDNLEHRGYGILFNPDWRILIGWGEGFTYEGHEGGGIGGHFGEVHSTLGGMLISYGLIGLSLFIYFLLKVFSKSRKSFGIVTSIILFMPLMLYGITHNGIRFSIFWIYLGIIYGFSIKNIMQTKL